MHIINHLYLNQTVYLQNIYHLRNKPSIKKINIEIQPVYKSINIIKSLKNNIEKSPNK